MKKVSRWLFFVFTFVFLFMGQKFVYAEGGYTDDVIPKMTTDNSPQPVVIQASVNNYIDGKRVSHPGWKAFDNDTSTDWYTSVSNPGGGHYLFIDFGSGNAKRIEKITLTTREIRDGKYGLKNWELYGLNDGGGWTKITANTQANNGQKQQYAFTNPNRYRYYRINTLNGYYYTNQGTNISISEIEMMEELIHQAIPNAPSNLVGISDDTVNHLSWNGFNVIGAKSYELKRSTTPGGPYQTIKTFTDMALYNYTYDDQTITNTKTYYYVLTARNEAGESGRSNEVKLTPSSWTNDIIPKMTGDNSPTPIMIQASKNDYMDTYWVTHPGWKAFDNDTSTDWYTSVSNPGGGHYLFIDFGAGNSKRMEKITLTTREIRDGQYGLKNWELYGSYDQYNWTKITANTQANNSQKQQYVFTNPNRYRYYQLNTLNGYYYTNQRTNISISEMEMMEKTFLPSNLAEVVPSLNGAEGDKMNSLSWSTISGATHYNVKCATTQSGPYTTIATNVTTTSFADIDVTSGTTYYYVVSAVNDTGESQNSNEITLTPYVLEIPTNLSGTAGDKINNLSWTKSNDALSYEIKRSTTQSGPYTTIATNVTTTSYTDVEVVNGTTYYYVVSAVHLRGSSGDSNELSLTPTTESLSLNKPSIPSSQYDANYGSEKAFDGNTTTRWADKDGMNAQINNGTRPTWLELDFGKMTTFNQVNIIEFQNRISGFKIQYFVDGQWQDAYTGATIGAKFVDSFPAVTGTKARLLITSVSVSINGGPSIHELGFSYTATPVTPIDRIKTITIQPDFQTTTADTTFSKNATINVTDVNGNPVANAPITLKVTGAATLSSQVTTDANGQASFTLSDSLAEVVIITATAPNGIVGTAPADFRAVPNLVFNQSFQASDVWGSGNLAYVASKAFDGDVNTRWVAANNIKEAWLEVDFKEATTFNKIQLIEDGNGVSFFTIQYWDGSQWVDIDTGTTIGANYTKEVPTVISSKVRLSMIGSTPSIKEFGIYYIKPVDKIKTIAIQPDFQTTTSDTGSIKHATMNVVDVDGTPVANAPITLKATGKATIPSQVSTDEMGKTSFTVSTSSPEVVTITATAPNGIVGTALADFRDVPNLVFNQSVQASSVWYDNPTYAASKAFDGDTNTRWAATAQTNSWLEVTFKEATTFNKVQLIENGSVLSSFTIQYWDGIQWIDIDIGTTIGANYTKEFPTVTGSKVKLSMTGPGPSLKEFGLYNVTN